MILMKGLFLVFMTIVSTNGENIIKTGTAEATKKSGIFPHNLYVYWSYDIRQASTFTQLCLNSIRKTAQSNNWEFVFLQQQNYEEYLSTQSKQQLKVVMDHKKHFQAPQFADLLRMFVLRDNGGMWVDINSFFVQDLSWIDNISKQKYIDNKLSAQPEMLMFTYTQRCGGNKTKIFDERFGKNVTLFPGLQIWALISKPQSKFLNDMLESITNIYKESTEKQFMKQNSQLGYQYLGEESLYFIYSNYHFQTLLQRKQRHMDANPGAYKQRYAIEYYNIWSIDGLNTALRLFDSSEWQPIIADKKLFYSTLSSIKKEKDDQIYFIKFTGQFYHNINFFVDSLYALSCLQSIAPIPDDSIFNQFVMKQNQDTEFVQRLRELQKRRREGLPMECNIFGNEVIRTVRNYALVFLFSLFAAHFLMFRCLKYFNKSKSQYQLIKN